LDITIFGANAFPQEAVPDWIYNIINTRYKFYKNCNGSKVIFDEPSCKPFLWMHFVKRSLFEKPNIIRFDESMMLGEDQLLQFQYVPRAKNIMVIEDKLYNYRIARNGSLMQLYSSRKITKVKTHMALVQKIIDCWKKEGIFETNQDYLATWITNFLYFSIIDLPLSYKKEYSEKILKIFENNAISTYLIAEWEQSHYTELQRWCISEGNEKEDIEELNQAIQSAKYEISETLKSRAFKLGRFFTNKHERLDLKPYQELTF
jgi:hypothetical protein